MLAGQSSNFIAGCLNTERIVITFRGILVATVITTAIRVEGQERRTLQKCINVKSLLIRRVLVVVLQQLGHSASYSSSCSATSRTPRFLVLKGPSTRNPRISGSSNLRSWSSPCHGPHRGGLVNTDIFLHMNIVILF